MLKVLLVGCGGFLGSISRYLIAGWIQRLASGILFPLGTGLVNITGCLLIGLLGGLADSRGVLSSEARTFLLIGVLGGYTTFSTFGYETFQLMRDGQFAPAALNVALQVILGMIGVWAGFSIARII